MIVVIISLVSLSIVVFGLCVLAYQMLLQNGRMLERLEILESVLQGFGMHINPEPTEYRGLPVGVASPNFDLPDLSGTHRSLSEWRGQRLLLVFFDPNSRYCLELMPALSALATDVHNGRPTPLIVTTGDFEENRRLFEEAHIPWTVLVDDSSDVAAAYYVDGAPMGYLIETDGTIASELIIGKQALLVKAGQIGASTGTTTLTSNPRKDQVASLRTRSLENSRINRDGLPAGTEAPIFRLPKLDGGELSLLEYRGRKVMLVFSDPDCGPCNYLAPHLEQVHQSSPGLSVIMISRGGKEANEEKVSEYGLTFPVVLQRHWEISREYGMFATPIGYLVDEWGIITAEVATGPDAILALASSVAGGREQGELSRT